MKIFKQFLLVAIVGMAAAAVNSQTYNSMWGGYNTSYGTIYGSFGMAQASQNMYNTMQMIQQQNMLRATLVKKHGAAAVQKAEDEVRAGGKSSIPVTPRPVPKNYGKFRPDAGVDTAKIMAETLGETPEERALYKQIVDGTKAAFEKEVSAKGWKNNIAGAFTFFIVALGTTYHDSPEPSDETVNALYEAMNQTIDEIPEFGKMSNRDKQGLYNTLIGFAGIPLATLEEGKQSNNQPTIKIARQLAGQLIQIVLKTDPNRLRFVNGEMKFS